MLDLTAARNEPHGVGTMVMSTVAMISKKLVQTDGRVKDRRNGRRRWEVAGLSTAVGTRSRKEASRSCTRFGLLSLEVARVLTLLNSQQKLRAEA
jgi:hypothetical protein